MLRPGYIPPSRFQLSSVFLNEIFEGEKSECFNRLSGQDDKITSPDLLKFNNFYLLEAKRDRK